VLLDSGKLITDRATGNKRPIQANDIAVLGPSHAGLAKFASTLRGFGILPQLKKGGLFESDAVKWCLYALAYLADSRDQHAAMCLKLLMNQEISLEAELKDFLTQEKPKKVKGDVIDQLNDLRLRCRFVSVSECLNMMIESLSLWERFASDSEGDFGQQQRANLLKLLSLAEDFENLQPETLHAQGVYGAGLSSFLLWLQINKDDLNTQPDIDGDNKNGLVLSTWHASKGFAFTLSTFGISDCSSKAIIQLSLPVLNQGKISCSRARVITT